MAKHRYVSTRFWNDTFIASLNPLERYLFLYFLTNEHTTISGVYELPLRTVSAETGVSEGELTPLIERLSPKIEYVDGWVWVRNFQKHNFARGHSTILKAIRTEMTSLPVHIREKLSDIGFIQPKTDTPSEGYVRGVQGGMHLYSDSYSDLDLDSNSKRIGSVDPQGSAMPPSRKSGSTSKKEPSPEINALIAHLQEKMSLSKLDKSIASNRRMAYLALNKFGLEQVRLAIDVASQDGYWQSRVTSMQDVYYNVVKILSTKRFSPKGTIQSL